MNSLDVTVVLWLEPNMFIGIKLSNEWNPFEHNIVPTEKLPESFLLGLLFFNWISSRRGQVKVFTVLGNSNAFPADIFCNFAPDIRTL